MFGGLLMFIGLCLLVGVNSQYYGQYYQQPQQSSSMADSNIVSNGFNLGKLFGISNTAIRSEAVTKNAYDGYDAQERETNNVYRNSLNVAGIPISNTIKTSNAISNVPISRPTGAFENTFNLGRLGITAGLTNDGSAGPLIGLVRGPAGGVNLNLGGLSLGVGPSNFATDQLDQGLGVQAVGTGTSSNVNVNKMDRQQSLGPIELHMSKSQTVAQASTNNGYSSVIGVNSPVQQTENDNNYYNNNQYNYQYDYHNRQNGYYQQQYQYQNAPNQYYNQQHYQQPAYYNQAQRPYYNPTTNPFTVSRGSFADDVQSSTTTQPSLQSNEQIQTTQQPAVPVQQADSSIQKQNSENLDNLINNVFTRAEVPLEPAGGKSLAELLSEQQTKSESDEPGAEFGLDVRSEERRRRRSVEDINKTVGGHRVRRYHDHYHNHHFGKSQHHDCHNSHLDEKHIHSNHNSGRSHYENEHAHSHHNSDRSYSHHDDEHSLHHNGERSNLHHEDDHRKHDTHDKPQTATPIQINRVQQIVPTAPQNDSSDVFNIDIRSDFGTRRKRDVRLRYRRDDAVVFGADEEKTFEEKLAAKEAAASTSATDHKDDATETSGEEEEEDGELDSRFGFIGGQRRRPQRPLAGLLSGLVGGVFNSIGGSGMLERGYDQYGRPVQQPYYSQQPQYPEIFPQPYPQQNPQPFPQKYTNQSPQSHGGSNPQQQYPQHVHRPPGFGGVDNHQTASANTQSQNYQNEFGQYQNNAGSSQSANLAADGSAGQLSAANTQQQNFQNEFGAGSKNSGQSQSANFDANGNLALTSSNSNTQHTNGPNGVRDEANSGAQSNVKNQFGTSSSGAQSDTTNYNENGKFGQQSHGSSQSTFQGIDGSLSGSNSDATSGNFEGPFGLKGQQSSSHSSSFNNGGVGNTGVSASAGSGTGFGGAQSSAATNSFNNQLGYQTYGGLPVFG